MRKSWFIIAFIVVTGITVALVWHGADRTQDIKDLIPENYSSIDRVQIIGKFDTILFERNDSLWFYGEEQLSTRAIKNLILTAANLNMKSIVPIEELGKPEFVADYTFEGKGKEAGSFTFQISNGEYYIYKKPGVFAYGVELVGYEDYALEKIFSVEPDHYREHVFLSLLPVEIERIEIDPLKGFGFMVSDSDSLLFVSRETGEDLSYCADTVQVRMLFSFFNVLRYERQIDPASLEEGAIAEIPDASIRVVDNKGKSSKFEVFPWRKQGGEKPDIFECIVRYNNTSKYYIMNYYYLDLLLRDIETYLDDCD